jgi:hypothetical protein
MALKEAVEERDEREEMRKLAIKDISDLYESIHLHFKRLGKYRYGHSALEKIEALIDEYINLSGQINPIKHKLEVANNHFEAQKKVTEAKCKLIEELKEENKGLEVTLESIEKVCTEAGIDTSTLDHEEMVESLVGARELTLSLSKERVKIIVKQDVELKKLRTLLNKAGYDKIPLVNDKVIALIGDRDMYAKDNDNTYKRKYKRLVARMKRDGVTSADRVLQDFYESEKKRGKK